MQKLTHFIHRNKILLFPFQNLHNISSQGIEIIAFTEIEQELWRRTAKDVYDTCKDK